MKTIPEFEKYYGWINEPEQTDELLRINEVQKFKKYSNLYKTGTGKIVLLHQLYENITGTTFPVWKQEHMDCVSFGYALAINILLALRISKGHNEHLVSDVATEPIYGGSRIQIGNDGCTRGGSKGIWAAKWVNEYGVLLRNKYDFFDLSRYNVNVTKEWGCSGVPQSIQDLTKEHPVRSYSLVTSYEEARDALANGYPIPVCSTYGFSKQRDNEGFSEYDHYANHCMCFIAVDDTARRPGLLCCNSFGKDWHYGPKRLNQPDGSFWVDAHRADVMLKQKDSFALSDVVGFEKINPFMAKLAEFKPELETYQVLKT